MQPACRPLNLPFTPPSTSLLMFRKLSRLSRPWLIFLVVVAWLFANGLFFILTYTYVRSMAASDGIELPTLWQLFSGVFSFACRHIACLVL